MVIIINHGEAAVNDSYTQMNQREAMYRRDTTHLDEHMYIAVNSELVTSSGLAYLLVHLRWVNTPLRTP
jgi:hypothetical protein